MTFCKFWSINCIIIPNFKEVVNFSKQLNKLVVITRGEKGAVAINGGEVVECGIQKNLKIVGLNYKDNIENAKNYLQELSNPYDILISDQSGLTAIEWGAYGVPETFLINKNKIIKKYIGPLTNKSMEEINLFIK